MIVSSLVPTSFASAAVWTLSSYTRPDLSSSPMVTRLNSYPVSTYPPRSASGRGNGPEWGTSNLHALPLYDCDKLPLPGSRAQNRVDAPGVGAAAEERRPGLECDVKVRGGPGGLGPDPVPKHNVKFP